MCHTQTKLPRLLHLLVLCEWHRSQWLYCVILQARKAGKQAGWAFVKPPPPCLQVQKAAAPVASAIRLVSFPCPGMVICSCWVWHQLSLYVDADNSPQKSCVFSSQDGVHQCVTICNAMPEYIECSVSPCNCYLTLNLATQANNLTAQDNESRNLVDTRVQCIPLTKQCRNTSHADATQLF